VDFDLLPQQPGPDYGRNLPDYYLQYPFVEGKYRSKWGMAFTQRITLDFGGTTPSAELAAEADLPVIAVLPAEWYAETKALGDMAAPVGHCIVLRSLTIPGETAGGDSCLGSIGWENTGVAPSYRDYRVALRLTDSAGRASIIATRQSIKGWLPRASSPLR
jgi:hypothetical protein